jgi:hypothetical protein
VSEYDQSLPSGSEVKNEWNHASTRPTRLHDVGRDNFVFFRLQLHSR